MLVNDKTSATNGKRAEKSMNRKQTPKRAARRYEGLSFSRRFTTPGRHPFDEITWEKRTSTIANEKGEVIFEQRDVEVPDFWSMLAMNVVVSKYFRGGVDQPHREKSVKQLVERVSGTIAKWGHAQGYFRADTDAETFYNELTHLLVHQKACFNSPVWFNMGIEERPQCSACFINSVEDNMGAILDLAKTEAMLFKWGSGAGSNLSPIRSSKERLSSGGWASGPVSFMKGYDAFAGVIKSGGKTRRAAKMQILNIDHPDVVDFIHCKEREERKAWALIDAGYDSSINGDAYGSVFFQNANLSVRVTDDFMHASMEDRDWSTRAVTDGTVMETFKARELMKQMAESAWLCGDPGVQFDTTINDWHTCPNTDRIHASNPCSEYMFLDNSACNLASLNLMKFRRPDGEFDVDSFRHAVDVLATAMEIIVDNSSYPTPRIEANSHRFRPLGLGYANLGALLMARGLPYDSEAGRAYSGAITALMHGQAYLTSARISAEATGPFEGYPENEQPFLRVIDKHRFHAYRLPDRLVPADLLRGCREVHDQAYALGQEHGFRNSQVTVLAPTGTIGFMMDCDTTGVEPDIALVKYKKLVGGGLLKIVNQTVPEALRRLGYAEEQVTEIVGYIDENETIEGAPHLKDEHLPVFDCAFKPASGIRSIHYMGHVRMMAAVQPFLSGAISKTVNMPPEATADEIMQTYTEAWRLGLKAIAIYRDGCKRTQPLNTTMKEGKSTEPAKPTRRRLPDERRAVTHKFSIGGHEGYLTVGMYEDGGLGEIFVTMAKEGSVVSGLMDAVATSTSIALQYGVPLKVLINKFAHMRFEPSGFTGNPQLPFAKSIPDYIFRWLALKFLPTEESSQVTGNGSEVEKPAAPIASMTSAPAAKPAPARAPKAAESTSPFAFQAQTDAPPCQNCGTIMVRSGSCYKCVNCGSTSGCS